MIVFIAITAFYIATAVVILRITTPIAYIATAVALIAIAYKVRAKVVSSPYSHSCRLYGYSYSVNSLAYMAIDRAYIATVLDCIMKTTLTL